MAATGIVDAKTWAELFGSKVRFYDAPSSSGTSAPSARARLRARARPRRRPAPRCRSSMTTPARARRSRASRRPSARPRREETTAAPAPEGGPDVEDRSEVREELTSPETEAAAPAPAPAPAPAATGDGCNGSMGSPVAGTVTGTYGEDRGDHAHSGVDLAAPSGTTVRAAECGTVSMSGEESGYGQMVCVRHAGQTTTCYAHLSERSVGVSEYVRAGQKIGEVGCTGSCTGPHVHFEVRGADGTATDPTPYLNGSRATATVEGPGGVGGPTPAEQEAAFGGTAASGAKSQARLTGAAQAPAATAAVAEAPAPAPAAQAAPPVAATAPGARAGRGRSGSGRRGSGARAGRGRTCARARRLLRSPRLPRPRRSRPLRRRSPRLRRPRRSRPRRSPAGSGARAGRPRLRRWKPRRLRSPRHPRPRRSRPRRLRSPRRPRPRRSRPRRSPRPRRPSPRPPRPPPRLRPPRPPPPAASQRRSADQSPAGRARARPAAAADDSSSTPICGSTRRTVAFWRLFKSFRNRRRSPVRRRGEGGTDGGGAPDTGEGAGRGRVQASESGGSPSLAVSGHQAGHLGCDGASRVPTPPVNCPTGSGSRTPCARNRPAAAC